MNITLVDFVLYSFVIPLHNRVVGQIERFEDDTSLSRNGNQYLRYYLVEAANSVIRHIPEYQEYYVKKFNEVPKHQHKRALVLTARKFVRLVDALLRNHQLYTPKGA